MSQAKASGSLWHRWRRLGLLAFVMFAVLALFTGALIGSRYYGISMRTFVTQQLRVLATPVYAYAYRQDLQDVDAIVAHYRIGDAALYDASAVAGWRKLQRDVPGFEFQWNAGMVDRTPDVPFVYESAGSPTLQSFRTHFRLNDIVADAPDEYGAMLKLAGWLGTRWDHGTDPLVGTAKVCDPVSVVEAGEQGAKYWCEVAARTTVHAASALGWQARVITASRDGYTWEHAVAELWSNQFAKWFVVDTDFNVVYEREGVPLSAFELSRDGLQLQRLGLLQVRMFAPAKPNLPIKDVIPFYEYIHVDLRNDWCLRPLKAGSPAGGDLSTWWTARPDMHRLLTAKVRNDDMRLFNWQINSVGIHALTAQPATEGRVSVDIALIAYSPAFSAFELKLDDADWRRVSSGRISEVFGPGSHRIQARVLTASGHYGPISEVDFIYQEQRGPGA